MVKPQEVPVVDDPMAFSDFQSVAALALCSRCVFLPGANAAGPYQQTSAEQDKSSIKPYSASADSFSRRNAPFFHSLSLLSLPDGFFISMPSEKRIKPKKNPGRVPMQAFFLPCGPVKDVVQ